MSDCIQGFLYFSSVSEYFTIYKRYFLSKFDFYFKEYLMQYSLKSRGTKYHFRWVKVPGTVPF